MLIVTRHHDFVAGHRIYGHENKCANLHGHGYRAHFSVEADQSALDHLGRVIDFNAIKSGLCQWLEDNWDHRMLLWIEDPWYKPLKEMDPMVVGLDFNPTAENLAKHLLYNIGHLFLPPNLHLQMVTLEETRKCSATVSRN